MGIITVNKNPEKLLGTKDNYFTLEAVTSGAVSISIDNNFKVKLYCSVNDDDWELLEYNGEDYTKEYNLNVGDKIHFKCDDDSFNFNTIENDFKFNVMGFMSSLWKGDNCIIDNTLTKIYQLETAFLNTEIVDASKLILPNNTTYGCYYKMFQACTSLTTAPSVLPATTLADDCYESMFNGCTSLTTAPELPATTLANRCYSGMFEGCTALTAAPELPATTLVSYCYYEMFSDCNNLNYIKAMFTTKPSNTYTPNWVSGVASTGTFIKNGAATWNVTGANGVPTGWTVETVSA